MKHTILALLSLFLSGMVSAQTIHTFVGSGNWNDNSNWSPQSVPGPNDRAVFNAQSGNCIVNVQTEVKSIRAFGYSGIITLDQDLIVRGDWSSFSDARFTGGGTIEAGSSGSLQFSGMNRIQYSNFTINVPITFAPSPNANPRDHMTNRLDLAYSTFNNTCLFEVSKSDDAISPGYNTFNGPVTFVQFGSGTLVLQNGAFGNQPAGFPNADVFNSTSTFVMAGTGSGTFHIGRNGSDFNDEVTIERVGLGIMEVGENEDVTASGNLQFNTIDAAGLRICPTNTNSQPFFILDGTNQTLTNASLSTVSVTIDHLEVAATGTSTTDLVGNWLIGNHAHFQNGWINSTSNFLLSFANGAKSTGGNDQSYAFGRVRKIGNNDFVFPIGPDPSVEQNYQPIQMVDFGNSMTNNSIVIGEYHNSAFNTGCSQGLGIDAVSDCEWWYLSGAKDYQVSIDFDDPGVCYSIANPENARVVEWDGFEWIDRGNETSGGGVNAHVKSAGTPIVTGILTLGYRNADYDQDCAGPVGAGTQIQHIERIQPTPVRAMFVSNSWGSTSSGNPHEIIGDISRETALLNWAKDHQFNHLILYGVAGMFPDANNISTTNAQSLVGFIERAHDECITISLNAVSDDVIERYKALHAHIAGLSNDNFDAILYENEYWHYDVVDCAQGTAGALSPFADEPHCNYTAAPWAATLQDLFEWCNEEGVVCEVYWDDAPSSSPDPQAEVDHMVEYSHRQHLVYYRDDPYTPSPNIFLDDDHRITLLGNTSASRDPNIVMLFHGGGDFMESHLQNYIANNTGLGNVPDYTSALQSPYFQALYCEEGYFFHVALGNNSPLGSKVSEVNFVGYNWFTFQNVFNAAGGSYMAQNINEGQEEENMTLSSADIAPEKNGTTIYPNPTAGTFSINAGNTAIKLVTVYTTTGQQVLSTSESQDIDISLLSPGIYIVQIDGNDFSTKQQLVVK